MNRSLSFLYTLFMVFILCMCFCFMPIYISYSSINNNNFISYDPNLEFIWPIPDSTTITSKYGKRVSPTAGASSFHKGIDIAAPENTPLYAICDGNITFAGFLGGGGYTITLSHENMKITY